MSRREEHGQALVEWAVTAFVMIFFALGMLAVGQVVAQYMAVRSAAVQAAYAAARAPSASAAQTAGQQAANEAVSGSQIRDFRIVVDVQGFTRGGTLTTTTTGCVGVEPFNVATLILGTCVPLRWEAHALIEPYRSRVG